MLTYALAAVTCLTVGPAMAGSATAPIVLAQAPSVTLGVGVGERDHDRGRVVVQERDHDRGRVEIRDGRRDFARDRIVVRGASSCRMITVRTRTPSGNLIIRKTRRCG
jgi:hypothetical protein